MGKNKYDYDLVIIGTGAGGSVAAHISAKLGKRVAVVEAAEFGGECPNWGCVPTKSLLYAASIYDNAKHGARFGIRGATLSFNYPTIKKWRDLTVYRTGTWQGKKIFDNEGVDVIRGYARFISPHAITVNRRHITSAKFLIASGSNTFIPPIEGLVQAGFITSKEATELKRPPKSVFIIGAGAIGCEFAEVFSVFGSKVIMADIGSRVLPKEDVEVGEMVGKIMQQKRDVKLLMSAEVIKVEKERLGKRVYFKQNGKTMSVNVEEILVAPGRIPNVDLGLDNAGVEYSRRGIATNEFMQTTSPHIYASGDCTGKFLLTHVAIYQSRIAASNMWHSKKILADYTAVPRAVFINPEVASVGMSEDECKAKKLKYISAIASISVVGRSNTSDEDDGFVKVIARPNGTIIGASVVSPGAGEMIHELTLAIQYKLKTAQVANAIHAFPTWSETVRVACNKLARQVTK